MSTPSASLGQELLCLAKCLDERSSEELNELDCVLVRSIRNDGASRAVHRCVLANGSHHFADEVAKLRSWRRACPHSEQWSNTLRLDASIEIVDMIIEHLYTRESIEVTVHSAIELCSALRRFGLSVEAKRVTEFIRLNVRTCLTADNLWNSSTCITDIDSMADIFDELQLDNDSRHSLIQRITLWGANDPQKSKKASELCRKLRPVPCTPDAPVPQSTAEQGVSSGQRVSAAVVGTKLTQHELSIVSLDSLAVLYSGRLPMVNSIHSVIVNEHIYSLTSFRSINVYSLEANTGQSSGETRKPLFTITSPDDDRIYGVHAFGGEMFFNTKNTIYVLDSEGVSYTEIARLDDDLTTGYVILRRDARAFSIAVQVSSERLVRELTFGTGGVKVTDRRTLQSVPPDMRLIGSHEGLLYFQLYRDRCLHYVAFRDGVEVKRHPIVEDGHPMLRGFVRVHGGVLYAVYFTDASYACAIDLHLDAVFFRKSATDLGLENFAAIAQIL